MMYSISFILLLLLIATVLMSRSMRLNRDENKVGVHKQEILVCITTSAIILTSLFNPENVINFVFGILGFMFFIYAFVLYAGARLRTYFWMRRFQNKEYTWQIEGQPWLTFLYFKFPFKAILNIIHSW